HLLRTEQAAPYVIPGSHGTSYETGGLAVTERPYRLLDARGRAHPRRFAYGVPTESVHWVTAAGIRPGVDSVTIGAADAITRAARADRLDLREIALGARETANPVVGLVAALTRVVAADDPAAAEYVHRGSTSQDIFDTGAMLVAGHALRHIRADLDA